MQALPNAIRARRATLNLSLDSVAEQVGVSKSYLSFVETGKRQLTALQAERLAEVLGVPSEMLLLETGRLPSDVEEAISSDVAAVTAAVRSKAEQYAAVAPDRPSITFPKSARISHSPDEAEARLPITIAGSKASTSYRAHSYHTKVPPAAITPFIEAFTEKGALVSDPFCGSGMTGVAALATGRNALLSDLSPAAVHIARNYTRRCDPMAFKAALSSVGDAAQEVMRWLYSPAAGGAETIEYTTWSDVFLCSNCAAEILYWDVRKSLRSDSSFDCPACKGRLSKSELVWLREVPVETHVSSGSNRIRTRAPSEADLALIAEVDAAPIPFWIPSVTFGRDREMWRAGHAAMGIENVAGFFTRRNLHALAALRHAIVTATQGSTREALLFAFTACVNRASRRYQWNAKRPTNVMSGTLYISSLRYEWNVWSLFRRKAADVLRYYENFPLAATNVDVFQRSATELDCIPDAAIDMVFMDPPFGSNIFYADSSLLWDAWLGTATDQSAEIVVNKHRARHAGGKDLAEYQELMTNAFAEAGRVLRRGGRAVLAFSNSDDRVWEAVQDSLSDAGFDVRSAHLLDKTQPSIKGVKGQLGRERVTRLDLLLCLAHRERTVERTPRTRPDTNFIDGAIAAALVSGARRTDEIYSLVLRDALRADLSAAGINMPRIEERCTLVAERDLIGEWQPKEGRSAPGSNDVVAAYVEDRALPVSTHGEAPLAAPSFGSVAGGRNSAFYLAHSYHTKVPPEAIAPFIEHFTKPGDVVLDPFAGSGMTGVAAALAGRRALLSDLSPAAVHLAWNHTHGCDPHALRAGFRQIEEAVTDEIDALYATSDPEGGAATIRWTVWSTQHRCPVCRHEFALWSTINQKSGRIGRATVCPRCHHESDRRRFEVTANAPAWIAFEGLNGKRGQKAADAADIERALGFRREDIEDWFPAVPIGRDREMYQRCALQLQQVHSVADFYTHRNLRALALLWREIGRIADERVRRALMFAFTNTAWHGTRMRRFNARGGHRPLTGTLYVPQLSCEANVLEVMRKKIGQLERYYGAFKPRDVEEPRTLIASATALDRIASDSVDYVFTDPPFGSNIFYADCNIIWEAWLGRSTDARKEAVVNRSLSPAEGGKSLADYASLMEQSMKEIARVLKPGGWATVVFHNTDAEVWSALRDAAAAAGFEFHEASSLDRKQQSHKGYKGREGTEDVAHFDVVMNLRKSEAQLPRAAAGQIEFDLGALVENAVRQPEVLARGIQGVHAEIMRSLVSIGSEYFPDFADVRTAFEQRIAAAV